MPPARVRGGSHGSFECFALQASSAFLHGNNALALEVTRPLEQGRYAAAHRVRINATSIANVAAARGARGRTRGGRTLSHGGDGTVGVT
jgi:hypothetical protein